jgi:agmatinase
VNEPGGVYLEASRDVDAAAVVIAGIPYDGGTSYRVGARAGPQEIRAASQSIETYSPRLRRDLEDVAYADAGDLELSGLDAETVMGRIGDAIRAHVTGGRFVVSLGGDHSISIGTTSGSRAARDGVAHVVFDAHLDMRPEYDGSPYSHACGTRHMAVAAPTVALGIRSGSRQEFADADGMLVAWSDDLNVPDAARDRITGRPVHLSIDLDVLDPSILAGTGNPEPGGATYKELREAVLAFAGLDVIAVDVCEVAPPLDPTGVSAVVAAELVREIILGLGPRAG